MTGQPGSDQKPSAPVAAGRSRSRFCLWVALLAAVLAVLLHESLFGGKGLVPADGVLRCPPWQQTNPPSNYILSDQYTVFVPQHEMMYQQFRVGKFPLWNPFLNCGIPNLGSMQGALLFPLNLLLLPLDPFYASGLAAFLKLFLAGWFTMLYLRLLGASDSAAFLSGLVFNLSGFMIVWLGHPHVNCAMWLPLLLYFIEKSFRYGQNGAAPLSSRPSTRVWAALALIFGCVILGGHPPTIVHVVLFATVYFLFRLFERRHGEFVPRTGLWLGAIFVGVLLAAPQILPFLEYYRHSSSDASSGVLDRSAMHLYPKNLIFYLLPRLAGSPIDGFEDNMLELGQGILPANFNERTGYVGILPWLFALYAVTGRRCRLCMFYLAIILASLLVILGLPPFPSLLGILPVLRDINPIRLTLLIGFSVAVLAGLGWDQLQRDQNRRLRLGVVIAFWAALAVAMLWLCIPVWSHWRLLETARRAFLQQQFVMLAGSVAASVVLILPSMYRHRGICQIICLGWVTMDLLVFANGYNPAIPHNQYYPTTPAIEWLKQHSGSSRIWGDGYALAPNTAEIYNLRDTRGSDFMTVRPYEQLVTGRTGDFNFYCMASYLPKPLELLGVKYVLMPHSKTMDPGSFEMVYSNEIAIYRDRAARDRALILFNYEVVPDDASILARVRSGTFDPQRVLLLNEAPENWKAAAGNPLPPDATNSSAHILSDQCDATSVEASLPQPGFLLLLDTCFPGWSAYVNGVKTPILRADYNFRAVPLPAGKSMVRFVYQPRSFQWGVVLFWAGLLVVAIAWFWPGKPPLPDGGSVAEPKAGEVSL